MLDQHETHSRSSLGVMVNRVWSRAVMALFDRALHAQSVKLKQQQAEESAQVDKLRGGAQELGGQVGQSIVRQPPATQPKGTSKGIKADRTCHAQVLQRVIVLQEGRIKHTERVIIQIPTSRHVLCTTAQSA